MTTKTTRTQAPGTTKRIVADTQPELVHVQAFRKAKATQSKGRKAEAAALAAMNGALVAADLTRVEVIDTDGERWVGGLENKKSDPKARAWDAYLASLTEDERKEAERKFYAPNVERKKNQPYIRKA